MRPVLITSRLVRHEAYIEVRDALDVRWGPFLAKAGLVPIPVSSDVDPADLVRAIPDIAGIVLSGGNDLSAVSGDPLSIRRDALESELCALMGRRPVMGVCRGFQFLAHRAGFAIREIPGHAGTRHPLTGEMTRGSVNSYHNYAPFGDAPGWRVLARSSDGMMEAAVKEEDESEGRRMGIMWHPEREEPIERGDVELFREFFS